MDLENLSIAGIAVLVASIFFVYQLLYSIWFVYSFYVDERKGEGIYYIFHFFEFQITGNGRRDDYLPVSMLGLTLSAFICMIIFLVCGICLLLFISYPYIFTGTVVGISSLIAIAKVHRLANNVKYKLEDHKQDKNAHQ